MVQPIPPEELSRPVQCETDPTAVNRVVVYGDLTYTPTSVSSVDSSAGLEGALEQQMSTGEMHHWEENPVFPYHRHWVSSGRWSTHLSQHSPTMRAGTRQRQNTPMVKMTTLLSVILLLLIIVFFPLIFNIFH